MEASDRVSGDGGSDDALDDASDDGAGRLRAENLLQDARLRLRGRAPGTGYRSG
jgi:hypothetical protein